MCAPVGGIAVAGWKPFDKLPSTSSGLAQDKPTLPDFHCRITMLVSEFVGMVARIIHRFLKLEAASGIVLSFCAAAALIFSNFWGLSGIYHSFLHLPVEIRAGSLIIAKPLVLWINDGLMAIFFLLVGLEIKREILDGELSSRSKLILPSVAAFGGMICPAIIYASINYTDPTRLHGWAIPAATDIAFSLGVLSLLGKRVPVALKVFLTALAIIDDLGAILIIALFYTDHLALGHLVTAAVLVSALFILNRLRIRTLTPYAIIGILLWVAVLKSGVHATLAGVALAFAIPAGSNRDGTEGLTSKLEHGLHPWVAYLILPLFAFANAGVDLSGFNLQSLTNPISLGIIFGLFFGKQLGIFGFSWLAIKLGLAKLPSNGTWRTLYGVAVLAGIGFTMSLFIGSLSFDDPASEVPVKIGVLVGSCLSATIGYIFLRLTCPRPG